ncbi:MAG: hypothetical protein FGM42_05130, partial [Ilumatobacteraceae bacterium]|nr:hypothetical protein [Ilumatobacteraceae bacterium]
MLRPEIEYRSVAVEAVDEIFVPGNSARPFVDDAPELPMIHDVVPEALLKESATDGFEAITFPDASFNNTDGIWPAWEMVMDDISGTTCATSPGAMTKGELVTDSSPVLVKVNVRSPTVPFAVTPVNV